jgi:chemotaxis protein MotB
MKRKRSKGQVSHERWLVSYADFITLLFAFFVVLFATGQSDKRKKAELAESIQSAFNQMGFFESHAKAAPIDARPESLPKMRQRLMEVAKPELDSGVIAIHDSPNGLVISLQEAGFFDSGSASVRPAALPVLNRIAAILPDVPLRIEGHTDDVPIHTPQFVSNWELSSSRASSIARMLLNHDNVHAEEMSVAGYAEYHPVADNSTAEGRARNRRVDIVLLTTP